MRIREVLGGNEKRNAQAPLPEGRRDFARFGLSLRSRRLTFLTQSLCSAFVAVLASFTERINERVVGIKLLIEARDFAKVRSLRFFVMLESSFILRHLSGEFVYNHFDGTIEIIRSSGRFKFSSSFRYADFNDALVFQHRELEMHIHRVQFKLRDLFNSVSSVLHERFRAIHVLERKIHLHFTAPFGLITYRRSFGGARLRDWLI